MLELSTCHAPNDSHLVHIPELSTSEARELNYITNIVLELKGWLAKINIEAKDLKHQLWLIHLSWIKKVRHSENFDLVINILFQHKCHFQNLIAENHFLLQDMKIKKEVLEKINWKIIRKAEKKEKNKI